MSRHVRATVAVAVLSLAVLGPPVQAQDKPSAQELADLRARAEAGDATAQLDLGLMYGTGRGVPQDFAEAVGWYRKAAEQGTALAQFALGYAYANGRGVPEDLAAARRDGLGEPHGAVLAAVQHASGYTQDRFEACVVEHFVIAETKRLQSGTRTMYYVRPKHAS